jgi:hypothetical protein
MNIKDLEQKLKEKVEQRKEKAKDKKFFPLTMIFTSAIIVFFAGFCFTWGGANPLAFDFFSTGLLGLVAATAGFFLWAEIYFGKIDREIGNLRSQIKSLKEQSADKSLVENKEVKQDLEIEQDFKIKPTNLHLKNNIKNKSNTNSKTVVNSKNNTNSKTKNNGREV